MLEKQRAQRNYSQLPNFQAPYSTNRNALYVKRAGCLLALLEHYFVDRFFLLFSYSCISYQGQVGMQFPCNSVPKTCIFTQAHRAGVNT